MQSQTYYTTK